MSTDRSPRDGSAFGCVLNAWRAHEAELLGFLRHQVGDPHLAEDLLQDVFVKAMRQGEQFCRLLKPRAWLFEVARNALVDAARRRRPAAPLDDALPAPETAEPMPVDLLADCVERTLPLLSAEDREAIARCDLDGWRVQDYAERNGLSLAAAKARLRRARIRLRERLVERCGVRFDERGSVCCALRMSPPR